MRNDGQSSDRKYHALSAHCHAVVHVPVTFDVKEQDVHLFAIASCKQINREANFPWHGNADSSFANASSGASSRSGYEDTGFRLFMASVVLWWETADLRISENGSTHWYPEGNDRTILGATATQENDNRVDTRGQARAVDVAWEWTSYFCVQVRQDWYSRKGGSQGEQLRWDGQRWVKVPVAAT